VVIVSVEKGVSEPGSDTRAEARSVVGIGWSRGRLLWMDGNKY